MDQSVAERRSFKRVFFSDKDNIVALLRLSHESDELIETRILNLSEGGVFVTASSSEKRLGKLGKGGRLTLVKISGTTPGLDIVHTEMEVRWTIYDKFLDHVGFGCEFIDISEQTKKQILALVIRTWKED